MSAGFILGLALVGPSSLPKELKPFDLSGSLIAKQFKGCSATEVESAAKAFKEVRVFMRSGPSELDCFFKIFDSNKDLRIWEEKVGSSSAAWFSPFRSKPVKGVHRASFGGMVMKGIQMPEAAVYDRFLITVRPGFSQQYSRHHPKEDKFKLPDKTLNRLASQAMNELILRARHYVRGA